MRRACVSVAMPVYNCEGTVGAAVRSIVSQTFPDWELIVIDDGSTDGTLRELQRFQDRRIRVYSDGLNRRLPARLNQAISVSTGEYLARMDGDDVSYPNRLEVQLEYLRSHTEVDLVGGSVLVFEGDGQAVGKRTPAEHHDVICRHPHAGFPMVHPTFVGKAEWFRRHGYSESISLCQDQDLLLRACESSCYANVSAIVLGYRDDLRLSKLLRTRSFFARMVLLGYLRKGRPIAGCYAVLVQWLKGGIDCAAVVSGLRYRLLRHRAGSMSHAEVAQWQQIWMAANQAGVQG